MVASTCLECGHRLELGDHPSEGQRLICRYCLTRMEIICPDPLELDWVYDEPLRPWEELRNYGKKPL
jgi:DNA-directed RNA polymerase subunit RPC12/RpoP